MSVQMVKAHAGCDDCAVTYDSNNAMALMAKHCKKMKHTGFVNCNYGVWGEGK